MKRRMQWCWAAPLACAAGLALAAPRPLAIGDVDRLRDVTGPACSPDGQWIAYTVEGADTHADARRASLWMVDRGGTAHVRLSADDASLAAASFSPDGRYVSFLAARADGDRPQLHLLDRRGGEPRVLAAAGGDITDYDWSPDGAHLVLAMTRPTEAAAAAAAPVVIDRLHFKEDRGGYLTAADRTQLYLLDVADGRLTPLTTDAGVDDRAPAWSPDGKLIAFLSARHGDPDRTGRAELYVVAPRAGAEPRLLSEFYAPNHETVRFSTDGRQIVVAVGQEPRFNAYITDHLEAVEVSSGRIRELAPKLDRALSSPAVLDAANLVAIVEDDGSDLPVRVPLDGGPITRLATGPQSATGLCAGGGRVAVVTATDTTAPEVHTLEAGRWRRLSFENDALVDEIAWGAVEDFAFHSRDGTEVHGMLVKPPGFVPGRAYPTIVWIHGGPNGQDAHGLNFGTYTPTFERQWLAAHGYLVLAINYRGSTGRGGAYARAIAADWGHHEVEDLLAGVDEAVRRGLADPRRLGIGGWSYGGILTDYTIASDGRFKAAVSGAGSADQLAMYGADQYILQYNAELGPPWRDTARWLRLSYPFLHADRIHTPTLFLGGDKDFNVPVAGGEQMYAALRTLGVPTQLVVYPGEYHLLTRPSHVRDRLQRYTDWFALHLAKD